MVEYGYARVSTKEQNEDRQLVALENAGIPSAHIFVDKQSGKDFNREKFKLLMKKVKAGDVIYIHSLDRLSRNYTELREMWTKITKTKGVDIVILDMPLLDTRHSQDLMRTFLSDIVLQLLAFVSENERQAIHTRIMQGMEIARAKGVKFGRPPIETPLNFEATIKLRELGKITLSEALKRTQLTKSTYYRFLSKYRSEKASDSSQNELLTEKVR